MQKIEEKSLQGANDKTEAKIQQEIVQWYRNSHCLKHHKPRSMIFSVPNEGRGAASLQLMATGLYPGCADLRVHHREYKDKDPKLLTNAHFFVECKTPEGVQSDKQKEFEAHCKEMEVGYYIVRSLEDFKRVIESL